MLEFGFTLTFKIMSKLSWLLFDKAISTVVITAPFDSNMENDRKTTNLGEKMKNKLRHVMRCSQSHAHFYKYMSITLYFLRKNFLSRPPKKKKKNPWKKPKNK